jgi:hypothetical protein
MERHNRPDTVRLLCYWRHAIVKRLTHAAHTHSPAVMLFKERVQVHGDRILVADVFVRVGQAQEQLVWRMHRREGHEMHAVWQLCRKE